MRMLSLIIIIFSFNSIYCQECAHWQYTEKENLKNVKSIKVWEHTIKDDSILEEKTLFSYSTCDTNQRITALRMYFEDTTFYEYSNSENWISCFDGKSEANRINREYQFSKTGKITYEKESGDYGHEYFFKYDSLDREIEMTILHDSIKNLSFYDSENRLSLTQHFKNDLLTTEFNYYYNEKLNFDYYIYHIYFDEETMLLTNTSDSTISFYSPAKKLLKVEQFYTINNEKEYSCTTYLYDDKGRRISANIDNILVEWKFDDQDYIIEAKRSDINGKLKFYANYKYEFWK